VARPVRSRSQVTWGKSGGGGAEQRGRGELEISKSHRAPARRANAFDNGLLTMKLKTGSPVSRHVTNGTEIGARVHSPVKWRTGIRR
jgi:hypothetical protein